VPVRTGTIEELPDGSIEQRWQYSRTNLAGNIVAALPFFEAEAKKRQAGRPKAGKKSAPIGAQLKHRAADDIASVLNIGNSDIWFSETRQRRRRPNLASFRAK
jgi:hypothetical protein